MGSSFLDVFFHPRGVAVVGASRRRGTIGGDLFHNLVTRALDVPVYPINRKASAVQSVHAYARVQDAPAPVDLAVVAVPARDVLAVVDDCAAAGVKALVVLSAGFREMGTEGQAVERELLARVRKSGMRMIGPNGLGILSTDPTLPLNATFGAAWPPMGGVAFGSQSGALGLAVLDYAETLGLGISQFVSLGNKADVSGNDLIEHWAQDARTKVILLYLESFGNPRRFLEIARRVTRTKPIVVVKSGRTKAGAAAASSHTGALAGVDVAVDAVLGQAGVIRTDTMEQLFDVARLLERQPVPAGTSIGILTNGGGLGIMAADASEPAGLQVAPLAETTMLGLRAFLPPEASVKNPVDMIASAGALSYERALRLMLADPALHMVLVLFVHPMVTQACEVADAIVRAAAGSSKPVVACLLGTADVPAGVARLRAAGIPAYPFPETGVHALAKAAGYGRWLEIKPVAQPILAVDAIRARAALEAARPGGAGWLDEVTMREILTAYGFRLAQSRACMTVDAALEAARELGFPVAVKLMSPSITHKTEMGGVRLDLRNDADVRQAWHAIRDALIARGQESAMAGVVVQEMVKGGIETLLGATDAREFGRLVAFGLGGIHVELLGDVTFGVPPLVASEAESMIDRLRAAPLLAGHRGRPAADRAALVDAILRMDRLVSDLPEIVEVDLNPLIARPPGQGAVVLDARMRVSLPV